MKDRKYKHRYEVAEEVLRRNGSNDDIQRRVLEEFPESRENPGRAQWYRNSWKNFHHCRGPKVGLRNSN